MPPTVFFQPEITPFIKLFTPARAADQAGRTEVYDAAPWWEKRIYDGGERVLKVGDTSPAFAVSQPLPQQLDHRSHQHRCSRWPWARLRPTAFRVSNAGEERSALLHPLNAHAAAGGGRDPHVPDVPRRRPEDTHFGLIILYTAFNLSFSVWLMKGFIDEIPKEYEEAALVDGYTRMQAFFKIVLPEAATGIAATAVFCFIAAWNEYAFALMMTNRRAQTAPPFIPAQIGSGLTDWTAIAAGTFLFLLPVAIFTFCLRSHLLRGVTFGAIRK